MARTIEKLKALQVSREKTPGYHADGGGLYLQITGTGAKSWIFRYRLHGRLSSTGKPLAREMGLGSFTDVSLAEAREKARMARKQVAEGIDPIEAIRAAFVAATAPAKLLLFREAAAQYIAAHKVGWKNPIHLQQWENTLGDVAGPVIGSFPVDAIDTDLVLKVIQPIWNTTPETANRLRGRIEAILDWAKAKKLRSGENPARWRGHLDQLLPKRSKVRAVRHHPAMPLNDLPAFVHRLRQQDSVGALALEFTILTAARTGETIGAAVTEMDDLERAWTVPGQRMKAGREHRVPLCARAAEIVRSLQPLHEAGASFVFPSPTGIEKPLSNAAMSAVLDRMGITDVTVHGFRSSFRDWASECTDFPSDVVEMALAHIVRDKTEAAYRRGKLFEKRRLLMDAWSNFIDSKEAKVIHLAARGG